MPIQKDMKNGERIVDPYCTCDLCGSTFGGLGYQTTAIYLDGKQYHLQECFPEALETYLSGKVKKEDNKALKEECERRQDEIEYHENLMLELKEKVKALEDEIAVYKQSLQKLTQEYTKLICDKGALMELLERAVNLFELDRSREKVAKWLADLKELKGEQ